MSEARAGGSAEFAERMLRTMNEAALALMVSVGHRTGLFDVMAAMPAATSAEIASRASLDERYVREWLAVMTTGRIVEHDGATESYWLRADHAAWLTRAAGMQNLATGMQYIGLLALVKDQIVDCFRRGGGVPYSAFPRFQTVMAEDSGAVHDATLVKMTLPLVPGLPPSTPCTTRLGRTWCSPGPPRHCAPTGSTSAWTPPPPASSRRT
jgi:hypothetical protein